MRRLLPVFILSLAPIAAQAATLEKLSFDEMIQKSTDVVRER